MRVGAKGMLMNLDLPPPKPDAIRPHLYKYFD